MGTPQGRTGPKNPREHPINRSERKRRRTSPQRSSSLTAFGEILRRSAKTLGLEPAVRLVDAREAWSSIVGVSLAEASRVVGLRGGVLMVWTAHPLVAQEIRLRRSQILSGLEGRFGPVASRLQVVVRLKGEKG